MSKNPVLNAAVAFGYIVAIVLVISQFVDGAVEDSGFALLIPMAMISLFTLSAAVMGYVFLFEPVKMFMAGEQKKGVTLFLQTTGIFAVLVAGLFIALLYLG
jgi:hypothetical protein